VDVGHADKNQDVARNYGMTLDASSLPAFTVLDTAGKPIARATGATLAAPEPAALDPKKVATFLTANQAPAPDADPPFKAALSQGKKEGKYVFLWFAAPW
jgi:hypothetical protein